MVAGLEMRVIQPAGSVLRGDRVAFFAALVTSLELRTESSRGEENAQIAPGPNQEGWSLDCLQETSLVRAV
jgi:hypothetical protein